MYKRSESQIDIALPSSHAHTRYVVRIMSDVVEGSVNPRSPRQTSGHCSFIISKASVDLRQLNICLMSFVRQFTKKKCQSLHGSVQRFISFALERVLNMRIRNGLLFLHLPPTVRKDLISIANSSRRGLGISVWPDAASEGDKPYDAQAAICAGPKPLSPNRCTESVCYWVRACRSTNAVKPVS